MDSSSLPAGDRFDQLRLDRGNHDADIGRVLSASRTPADQSKTPVSKKALACEVLSKAGPKAKPGVASLAPT